MLERFRVAVILEIAFLRDAVMANHEGKFLSGEQFGKLGFGPAIEFAFVPFAIGILGGIPAAIGVGHITRQIAHHIAHYGGVALFAADEVGIEVEVDELGVVVEHFLEMRH